MTRKADEPLLWDMLSAAREIQDYMTGVDESRFMADGKLRRAIERLLEVIGEAARHVSSGFKVAHSEIPWEGIVGQRHVLAHDYAEILPDRIFHVATVRIPELIGVITPLVPLFPPGSSE